MQTQPILSCLQFTEFLSNWRRDICYYQVVTQQERTPEVINDFFILGRIARHETDSKLLHRLFKLLILFIREDNVMFTKEGMNATLTIAKS